MPDDRTMSAADMIRTDNEWMRRFIEEPENFEREFRTVQEFLKAAADGRDPDYGDICAAYRFQLLDEMTATPAR
jgi:hypothetical protein